MINNKVKYLYSKEDNFDQKLNQFLRSRNISDVDIEKIVFDNLPAALVIRRLPNWTTFPPV